MKFDIYFVAFKAKAIGSIQQWALYIEESKSLVPPERRFGYLYQVATTSCPTLYIYTESRTILSRDSTVERAAKLGTFDDDLFEQVETVLQAFVTYPVDETSKKTCHDWVREMAESLIDNEIIPADAIKEIESI